jgi:hypothetical protein
MTNDWPINCEPDIGDIESACYERGYVLSQGAFVLRCGAGDHPLDDYGSNGLCGECRDIASRDAAAEWRIDEAIERRHFG